VQQFGPAHKWLGDITHLLEGSSCKKLSLTVKVKKHIKPNIPAIDREKGDKLSLLKTTKLLSSLSLSQALLVITDSDSR